MLEVQVLDLRLVTSQKIKNVKNFGNKSWKQDENTEKRLKLKIEIKT